MSRVGDRQFLYHWQVVKAATQPHPEATTWRVGDVEWRRSRHSIRTPDHAVALDVCRMDRRKTDESWSVMIVAEAWWDERGRLVRSQLWAAHLSGERNAIAAWLERQAEASPTDGRTRRMEASL
jgi:hypothetical protein